MSVKIETFIYGKHTPPLKPGSKPGLFTIQFDEETREERVREVNWENPKDEKSGRRFDILYPAGTRLENIAYASAIYWINRGVAHMVQLSDGDNEARDADRQAYARQQQRIGQQATVAAGQAAAQQAMQPQPQAPAAPNFGLTPPPGQ